MISDAQLEAYRRDGFIVVANLLSALRQVIAELVAGAADVETHTAIYDLEPGHSRATPKVRRIKTPHTRCMPRSTRWCAASRSWRCCVS